MNIMSGKGIDFLIQLATYCVSCTIVQAILIRAYYVVKDQAIQYRERTAIHIKVYLCFQREWDIHWDIQEERKH